MIWDRRAGRRARVSPPLGITRYLGAFGQKPPRFRRSPASLLRLVGHPRQAILQFVLIFNLGASIRSEGDRRVGSNATYADTALRDCLRTRSVTAEDDAEAGQSVESTEGPDWIQPSYKPYLGNESPRRASASNKLALFED
jgi:hypothetical protein